MAENLLRIRQLMALAEQALHTAQVNLDIGDYRATVNRAYYATFLHGQRNALNERGRTS